MTSQAEAVLERARYLLDRGRTEKARQVLAEAIGQGFDGAPLRSLLGLVLHQLGDLTGCAQTSETVAEGGTLADLLKIVFRRFPKLAAMERSMLVAVGVDYQPKDYILKNGDEVSLFPPVQGG